MYEFRLLFFPYIVGIIVFGAIFAIIFTVNSCFLIFFGHIDSCIECDQVPFV